MDARAQGAKSSVAYKGASQSVAAAKLGLALSLGITQVGRQMADDHNLVLVVVIEVDA